MTLSTLDWIIIGAYFVFTLVIGLAFRHRAGRSLADYFVSGRSLPWWLAGTSMVATTFAADTPIAVTGIVAREGVSGNWIWWCLLPSGLATVFFFAALWRRAGVITDVELIAIRYSGAPARFLRTFRAVYLGILLNGFILGWVSIAMVKILGMTLGTEEAWLALLICMAITLIYVTLSGLWGVAVTDVVQFVIGMGGTLALAFFAVDAVGGLDGLKEGLARAAHPQTGEPYGDDVDALLSFLPGDAAWSVPALTFCVFLAVNWWATWYPGAEPGGGGYIAQRLFASKNERHAILAGLWFNIAHYAIRPWPWIVAGLCGIAIYGNTLLWEGKPDPEITYVQLILDYLPSGWRGLLLAAFAAAFMSTVSTQINWGASYLVNDVYRPLIAKGKEDRRKEIIVGRVSTALVLLIAVGITRIFDSVKDAWEFVFAIGAGTGLVLILRWFWWRVNAWSEIAAMTAALVTSSLIFLFFGGLSTGGKILATVAVTTPIWLIVTLVTRPESSETLRAFQERVRAPGPGWKRVSGVATPPAAFAPRFVAWFAALAFVYGILFGIGHFLIGTPSTGYALLGAAGAGGVVLWLALRHPCFAGEDS